MLRELAKGISLEIVDKANNVLFSSSKKWLHPLLDAEVFLQKENLDAAELLLHDRIAGRAAAALAVRMGFQRVKLELMSQLAAKVYEKYNVEYEATEVVNRIMCQTEDMISDEMSLDEIYNLIQVRAQAALKR
ncbi:MAG: DUF1893 domain-containing protein [Sphaerochaetaceae bacterium]